MEVSCTICYVGMNFQNFFFNLEINVVLCKEYFTDLGLLIVQLLQSF